MKDANQKNSQTDTEEQTRRCAVCHSVKKTGGEGVGGEGGWGGGVAQRTKYYFYKWLWSMPEHKCEKLCVSAGFYLFIFFL